MAKLNRAQLKSMVKEILIEILSEGLGTTSSIKNEIKNYRPQQRVSESSYQQPMRRPPVPNNNVIKQMVNNSTKNPVLASIFEDTAKTTLSKQGLSLDDSPSMIPQGVGIDRAAIAVAYSEPTEMFDEATINMWSEVAFDGNSAGPASFQTGPSSLAQEMLADREPPPALAPVTSALPKDYLDQPASNIIAKYSR
jgi:hypothetical protein